MVTYTRQRRYPPRTFIPPDSVERLRVEEIEQERCDYCKNLWPASLMHDEDGKRICFNHRNPIPPTRKAEIEQADAQYIASRQTRPQRWPITPESFVAVTKMLRASGTRVTQGSPLQVVRGAASIALILRGVNLSTADTYSASSGISLSRVVDSTVQVTLGVTAAGGMTPGDHDLIYNGTTFMNVFSVR